MLARVASASTSRIEASHAWAAASVHAHFGSAGPRREGQVGEPVAQPLAGAVQVVPRTRRHADASSWLAGGRARRVA